MEWARHVDVVSYDSYPDPLGREAAAKAAFCYDVMRVAARRAALDADGAGARRGQLAPRQRPKPPGAMRLWSWQAVAHGADSVMFFQWRQSRGGAEKFFSAMVPHGGASSRTFGEVRELGRELAGSAGLQARGRRAPTWRSSSTGRAGGRSSSTPTPAPGVRFMDAVMACHRPLYEAGVACDVVRPDADLSGYRLVVVPNLYLASEEAARNLERYVEEGGTLVMSFFPGSSTRCDRVHLGGYPAPFRRMLGLWVEEFHPLAPEETSACRPAPAGVWSELVHLEGAEAVERFASGELAGRPAVTRHAFGRGHRVVPRHPAGPRDDATICSTGCARRQGSSPSCRACPRACGPGCAVRPAVRRSTCC